jgi:thiosulfate/3-mercaptopyruvate sulfurtransferase
MAAWTAAGLPTEAGAPAPRHASSEVSSAPFGPAPEGFEAVDQEAAWQVAQQGPGRLLDARAPDRYRGETEPLDPVAGHIPGAFNLPYGSLLQPDGRLLEAPALRERVLSALGPTAPADAVLSCGSGVTACALRLAFETAGLGGGAGPAVYIGSWSEWSRTPGRPVATGSAP